MKWGSQAIIMKCKFGKPRGFCQGSLRTPKAAVTQRLRPRFPDHILFSVLRLSRENPNKKQPVAPTVRPFTHRKIKGAAHKMTVAVTARQTSLF